MEKLSTMKKLSRDEMKQIIGGKGASYRIM
jgi:bacteriocin-like protein